MKQASFNKFFDYAVERYMIKLRRARGDMPPYTDDDVMNKYFFCNVFREDDKTTQWIRERITEAVYTKHFVGAMIIARWFNRISTLEKLLPQPDCSWDLMFDWNETYWAAMMYNRLKDVHPLVTGAYMIKTPAKMNKLGGVIWCLNEILPDAVDLYHKFSHPYMTLERATQILCDYPYMGPFMAYEVVTDLRHSLLSEAEDIMTWANPGPGAVRGLNRLLPDGESYKRDRKVDAAAIQHYMGEILARSQDNNRWSHNWPAWEMRDVEHTLCEYHKYCNALEGKSLKRRYNPCTQ